MVGILVVSQVAPLAHRVLLGEPLLQRLRLRHWLRLEERQRLALRVRLPQRLALRVSDGAILAHALQRNIPWTSLGGTLGA